jgi:hypothetical protein
MLGFAGVTVIEVRVAVVTESVVDPVTLSSVAVIVDEPTPTPVAKPAVEMVATDEVEELQVTELVRFCGLPLLYVPVAVNCSVPPAEIDGFTGVTVIETRPVAETLRDAVPLILPDVAVMVALPLATPVARPEEFTVAMLVAEELQLADAVKSCVLLSLKVPVALNCCVPPTATDALAGVRAMDVSLGVLDDEDEELHPTEKITTAPMTTEVRIPIKRLIVGQIVAGMKRAPCKSRT